MLALLEFVLDLLRTLRQLPQERIDSIAVFGSSGSIAEVDHLGGLKPSGRCLIR